MAPHETARALCNSSPIERALCNSSLAEGRALCDSSLAEAEGRALCDSSLAEAEGRALWAFSLAEAEDDEGRTLCAFSLAEAEDEEGRTLCACYLAALNMTYWLAVASDSSRTDVGHEGLRTYVSELSNEKGAVHYFLVSVQKVSCRTFIYMLSIIM